MHRSAGGMLTPLETAALIEFSHRLPAPTQEWLADLALVGDFGSAAPQLYCRQSLAENIDVYRDPFVPTGRKSLIIAFCGAANRMMISTPCLLQYLPSDRYDLVLLRDPTKLSYLLAIPPYAHTFRDLVQRLAADIGVQDYRRVYCFGTSMGGFPALRCGIMLKTQTAISCGGHFPAYPTPYWTEQELDIPAFDLLCDCHSETTTTLICCYSTGYSADVAGVENLARIYPVRRIPIAAPQHNFFTVLHSQGRLRMFIEGLFGEASPEGLMEKHPAVERVGLAGAGAQDAEANRVA